MKRKVTVVVTSVLLALPLVPAVAQEGRRCTPEDISSALRIGREAYSTGEPVRMRLVMKNVSTKTCSMELPSGRHGTVRVYRAGDLIWEYGICRAWTAHIEYEEWEPGHRKAVAFRWRQFENNRNKRGEITCDGKRPRAEPGRYRASGVVFGTDPDEETTLESFRITG